jgi:hypothetical protein
LCIFICFNMLSFTSKNSGSSYQWLKYWSFTLNQYIWHFVKKWLSKYCACTSKMVTMELSGGALFKQSICHLVSNRT